MAINERLVHTASAAAVAGTGNQEEGLILHLDANDVDSYDGDGSIWYDIKDHEYTTSIDIDSNFKVLNWNGNGTSQDIPTGFKADFFFAACTTVSSAKIVQDSVRGINQYWEAAPGDSNDFQTASNFVTAFNSDSISIGNGAEVNFNARNFRGLALKAGDEEVINNDGTQQTTVSVNTDIGFSIVKGTGRLYDKTFGHGLGVKPKLFILKQDGSAQALMHHAEAGGYFEMNNGNYAASSSSVVNTNLASSFSGYSLSVSDTTLYCFEEKRGFSRFGTYTGTGAAGNKVYCGFEPAFVIVRKIASGTTNGFFMFDNLVNTSNPRTKYQHFARSGTFITDSAGIDFNGDGFTVNSTNTVLNGSGSNFMFIAFAKNTNETELATTSSGVWSGFQNAVTSITSDSTHPSLAPGTADTATTSSIFDTVSMVSMGDNGTTEANNEMFITLDAAKSVKGFAVYEKFSSGYTYTGTTKLYGSTDNSNWYLLGSTVQNTSIEYNRNETTFAASPEYQYYKFTLSANTRGTYQIAWAFELISDFDVTPSLHLDPASYSGSGTTWTADTGNNGTLVGNTSYDQELGDFFDLDGSGDYISLNSSGYLTGDFTVEMWWNFDTLSGFKMLWGGQAYDNATGLGHYINGNALFTYISVSGAAVSPTGQSGAVLTAGKWHHIVLTRNGGTYTQYVDGDNVGSGAGSTASLESANTYIGAHYNNTAYNVDGRVGQVRVYSSALSQDKIRQNYNFTKNDYPNGFNGTINGATFLPSGVSFDFDGTDDRIQISTTATSPINPSSSFTISLWVNHDDLTGHQTYVAKYGSTGSTQSFIFGLDDTSNKIRLVEGTGSGFNIRLSDTAITSGSWTHIAVTSDNEKVIFYIDGVEEGTITRTQTRITGGTEQIYIGERNGGSQPFDGKISDIKIFDRVLTSDEISVQEAIGYNGIG